MNEHPGQHSRVQPRSRAGHKSAKIPELRTGDTLDICTRLLRTLSRTHRSWPPRSKARSPKLFHSAGIVHRFPFLVLSLPWDDLHYQTRPSFRLCATTALNVISGQSRDLIPHMRSQCGSRRKLADVLYCKLIHMREAHLGYAVKRRLSHTCPKA